MTKYLFLFLAITLSKPSFLCAQAEIPIDSIQIAQKQSINFDDIGLSIQIFSNWFIQDSFSHQTLMDKSKKIIVGDNEKLLGTLDQGEAKINYLLTAFKYPLDDRSRYNPSIAIVAEDLSMLPSTIDAEQYLTMQKQLLQQSQAGFRVQENFVLKRISGQRFYSMQSLIKYGGVYIRQIHYTTIHRGRALSVIISFVRDESQIELEEMVRTILVR